MALDLVYSNPVFSPGTFGNALTGGNGTTSSPLVTTNVFSIEGWLSGAQANTIEVGIGQSSTLWIGSVNGKFAARCGSGTSEIAYNSAVDSTVATPRWCVLAGDATGTTFYIDGVAITNSPTTATAGAANFTHALQIRTMDSSTVLNAYPWSGAVDEVAVWSVRRYTGTTTIARPTAAYVGTEPGLVAVYHLDTAPAATPTVFPNNAGFLYSPYSWLVGATAAKSINPGASVRTVFSGTTCTLFFDLTNLLAPLPQLKYRVDNGPWVRSEVAASIVLTLDTTSRTWPAHLLEIVFVAATETQARWTTQTTALQFLGIAVDGGAVLTLPGRAARNVLMLGDSITEGVRTLRATAASTKDTDRNDASLGYAFAQGQYTNAEVGVIGFGATGLTVAGSGGVPVLGSSWKFLWAGQARDFSTPPNLIVVNIGTNDGTTSITASYTALLNDILATLPAVKVIALQPFNQVQGAGIQSAVTACSDPTRVSYQASAGYWLPADSSDNLHPYGYAHIAYIAPKLGAAAATLLGSTPAATIPTGVLAIGKNVFKFVGAAAVAISGYPALGTVYRLLPGAEWEVGTPTGPGTQAVNQFVPGSQYYVFNTSAATVSVPGAQV